ncbi:MAG: hypothetical protein F6J87_30245 [Spirulina sp. SIO3F2]|nr:hypothetical protein [Spirulina sp. SIO3F2]
MRLVEAELSAFAVITLAIPLLLILDAIGHSAVAVSTSFRSCLWRDRAAGLGFLESGEVVLCEGIAGGDRCGHVELAKNI